VVIVATCGDWPNSPTPASGARAQTCPAVLLCFDLLALDGRDLRGLPLSERRRLLHNSIAGVHPCLQVVVQTDDHQVAQDWLRLLPAIEGVVARANRPYLAGRTRDWVKLKRQRSADCAVIGLAGDMKKPSLALGFRHADGPLHHFGVTRPAETALQDPRCPSLEPTGPEQQPIRSRWQQDAVRPGGPLNLSPSAK
jgi:ATP-dependent DNA ligase